MTNYYTSKLASNILKQCYDIAPARVQQHLDSEIRHVVNLIQTSDFVLELGCGYGRVLEQMFESDRARSIVGIDTSKDSLELAREFLQAKSNLHLFQMDAQVLGFQDSSFDKTICIQNGISAFKIEPAVLVLESVRVTKDGGICIFSSYSDDFWEYRLKWFELQSEKGLLGEIDWNETGNGVIVCKDGFRATTFRKQDFRALTTSLNLNAEIREIDQSSVFCEVYVKK